MIWFVAVLVAALAFLAYVVWNADKPLYYRQRKAAELDAFAQSLVVSCAPGSVVVLADMDLTGVLELVKEPDTGGVAQSVTLRLSGTRWPKSTMDAAEIAVRAVASGGVTTRWDASASASQLEARINGLPAEIGAEARRIGEVALNALGFPPDHRYTLYTLGESDARVWRRLNRESFEAAAVGRSWLFRWFARRQLRRLEHDEGSIGAGDEPSN